MDRKRLVDLEVLIGRSGNDVLLQLPLDIILDVFSRLPIKTLAVCRCVCKTWRSMIHHPRFTKLHHTRATKYQNCLTTTTDILGLNLFQGYFRIMQHPFDASLENSITVKFPFKSGTIFQMVGSCNGLVCLADFYDPIYVLNPLVGEYIKLPRIRSRSTQEEIYYGFGFDKITNEYKVIRVVGKSKAEIFTLGTSKWRKLARPCYWLYQNFSQVFVSGALHWLREDRSLIIAFDIGKEEFRVVPHPSGLLPPCRGRHHVMLCNLGGYLCLQELTIDHSEIWVMKNYGIKSSWTKEYVISRNPWNLKQVYLFPIAMMENGNVLLMIDDLLVSYDPVKKSFEKMWSGGGYISINIGSFSSLEDIVGITNGKYSVNTGRWFRKLHRIPVKPKLSLENAVVRV